MYIHNVRGYSSVTHAVALRVAKQREPLVTGSSLQLQSGARQDGSVRLYLVSKKLKCVLGCLIVMPDPYDYRPCVKISCFPSLVGEGDFILECSAVREQPCALVEHQLPCSVGHFLDCFSLK